jgi:hypothetical protein
MKDKQSHLHSSFIWAAYMPPSSNSLSFFIYLFNYHGPCETTNRSNHVTVSLLLKVINIKDENGHEIKIIMEQPSTTFYNVMSGTD